MIAIAALLLFASGAGTPPPPARICYGNANATLSDCASLPDADTPICAAHASKAYVLFRRAAHELTFDFCSAKHELQKKPVDVLFERVDPAAALDVVITDGRGGANRWRFTSTQGELASIKTIAAPPGEFRITVRAAHYRETTMDLKPHARLVLRRLPVISGKVLTAKGEPVASASVQPIENCVTVFDGSFRCEAREWPAVLIITRGEMPSHVVAMESPERDTELGEIRMSRGGRLKLSIDAPAPNVTVQLFRDLDAKPAVEIVQRSVRTHETSAIENLDPGSYRLLIRGSRPLQQHGMRLTIKDGDNDQQIAVEHSELTLRVLAGSQPESDATITLKNLDGRWIGTLSTDDEGSITEPLWQAGTFTAAVQPKESAVPFLDHREFSAAEKQQWTIQLPSARIEGHVLDESGAVVAGAGVHLTTDDGDTNTAVRTIADAEGHYRFDRVRAGAQTLTAEADGYLPSDTAQFRVLESEVVHAADLTVRHGQTKNVEIVDRRGIPLPNAALLEVVDNVLVSSVASGGDGRAAVQVPASGSAILFIVPVTGSFAVHRISAIDRDSKSIRVAVSDPTAVLSLKTETTEHEAVRGVHFLVRYEGEIIPFDVLMQFAQRFGIVFETGADGTARIANLPPGLYELWPYAAMRDVAAIMAGSDVPAPLRIALVEGTNAATLTFRTEHH